MPISDRDDIGPAEFVRIAGIGLWSALRTGGEVSAQAERRIDRILERAAIREDRKAALREAVRQARADAEAAELRAKAARRAKRRWF
jgi:hypothetical protein